MSASLNAKAHHTHVAKETCHWFDQHCITTFASICGYLKPVSVISAVAELQPLALHILFSSYKLLLYICQLLLYVCQLLLHTN